MQKHIIYWLLSGTHNIWNQKTDRETEAKTKADTDKHTNNQHFKYTSSYIQQTQTEACMHVCLPLNEPACLSVKNTCAHIHSCMHTCSYGCIDTFRYEILISMGIHPCTYFDKTHIMWYANIIPTSQSTSLPTYIRTYLRTDIPASDN